MIGRMVFRISATTAEEAGPMGSICSGASSPQPPSRSSFWLSSSRRSTVSPVVRHVPPVFKTSGRGPSQAVPRSALSGSKPSARSSASARRRDAFGPTPSPRGTRARAIARSSACCPVGDCPKIWSPSRICASFSSQRYASSLARSVS